MSGVQFSDSERRERVYDPRIFTQVTDLESAKRIILTPEKEYSTDERWKRETPHIADRIQQATALSVSSVVLDYGCGVGRMAREILKRQQCTVIGTDISPNMRALAASYVPTGHFFACDPDILDIIRPRCDIVLAIWVLQHVENPRIEIERILRCMKDEAVLVVVNEKRNRFVPTDQGWVDDGISINEMLDSYFERQSFAVLDPDVVGEAQSQRTFIAAYKK